MCYCFLTGIHSLANACLEGNVNAVRKLLEQGWSVHDSTDEGESLLSLACSAGETCEHFSKATVLLNCSGIHRSPVICPVQLSSFGCGIFLHYLLCSTVFFFKEFLGS